MSPFYDDNNEWELISYSYKQGYITDVIAQNKFSYLEFTINARRHDGFYTERFLTTAKVKPRAFVVNLKSELIYPGSHADIPGTGWSDFTSRCWRENGPTNNCYVDSSYLYRRTAE